MRTSSKSKQHVITSNKSTQSDRENRETYYHFAASCSWFDSKQYLCGYSTQLLTTTNLFSFSVMIPATLPLVFLVLLLVGTALAQAPSAGDDQCKPWSFQPSTLYGPSPPRPAPVAVPNTTPTGPAPVAVPTGPAPSPPTGPTPGSDDCLPLEGFNCVDESNPLAGILPVCCAGLRCLTDPLGAFPSQCVPI